MRSDVLRCPTRRELLSSLGGGNSNSSATPELELKQVIVNQVNNGIETAAVHLSAAALALYGYSSRSVHLGQHQIRDPVHRVKDLVITYSGT